MFFSTKTFLTQLTLIYFKLFFIIIICNLLLDYVHSKEQAFHLIIVNSSFPYT